MYLVTQFPWPAVREFHAAVLFEIDCGRARWGDLFWIFVQKCVKRVV